MAEKGMEDEGGSVRDREKWREQVSWDSEPLELSEGELGARGWCQLGDCRVGIEKDTGALGPERKSIRGFHVFGMLLRNRGGENCY